jgi:ribosomal protein S27AE
MEMGMFNTIRNFTEKCPKCGKVLAELKAKWTGKK